MTEVSERIRRAAIALVAVGLASAGNAQPIEPAPAFKGDALVAAPAANWPTNGGNWYNQRYSPLTQIDGGNVANLKGVWRTRLRGSGVGTKYSGEALFFGANDNRANAMKAFLDDKTFKPGLEHFKKTK